MTAGGLDERKMLWNKVHLIYIHHFPHHPHNCCYNVIIIILEPAQLTNIFLRFSWSSILPKCRASEAQWHISRKKLNEHCQRHNALKALSTLTDTIITCRSEKKLLQALNSWSNFILVLFGKRREIHVTILTIPNICHFFTQAKFLENKICTEKRQFLSIFANFSR